MVATTEKNVEYLIADTTAFIQNAPLQNVGKFIVTCQEVVDEITSKRQLRRLVVLPYDLVIKNVDPENVRIITEFAKKTGDYPSLSATDIKVMALTYQLEREHVGTEHLRHDPVMQRTVNVITSKDKPEDVTADITGFYVPGQHKKQVGSRTTSTSSNISDQPDEDKEYANEERDLKEDTENDKMCKEMANEIYEDNKELSENDKKIKNSELNIEPVNQNNIALAKLHEELSEKFKTLDCASEECLQPEENIDDILVSVEETVDANDSFSSEECDESDDEAGWITPSNVQKAKKQINSELMEEKNVKVACMTTDFAMQNVLKQMNLSVAALDGRLIKQLRTFILRCYTCFGTTSIMTKVFCQKCGNKTLKRVAVSVDENGKQQIHINARKPLTARGKKFSLPRIQGGKHSNNPRLVEDQPMPDQRPTRLAKMKNNPLDDDYIAGYSPFVMRDVTSKSAQLKIRPATEVKHWMRKNPNEAGRCRKK